MAMIINSTHMDGDNAEAATVIANGSTDTPDVELHPYTATAAVNGDWQVAMQSFTGCLGKTPEFTFLIGGASPKYDGPRVGMTYQQAGRPVMNPQFSYDGISWTKFANADDGAGSDLVFSHNAAFTGDTVQISLTEMWTWTRMKAYLNNVWHGHAFIDYTTSGGNGYSIATYPGDTDLESRVLPAMDWVGFKISHPDFRNTYRRKMVIMAGNHTSEHSGIVDLVQFVDDLLSATKPANGVQGTDRTTAELAYEVLRFFDVYVYPVTNPAVYFSEHDHYQGAIVSGYDFENRIGNINATIHKPLRDAIEADIESDALATISFHGHIQPYVTGNFYQRSTVGIADITRVSTEVTVTTDAAHGRTTGDWTILENNTVTAYDGGWQLTSADDTTHFTFEITGTPADDAGGAGNIALTYNDDEDARWEYHYGEKKYWYDQYQKEIESGATQTSGDRPYSLRVYSRENWNTEFSMTPESGQWMERTAAEVEIASRAALHTIVSFIEDGRTSIPRTSANSKIK